VNKPEPRHPIQVVARRTGLSADVIRAWERRYQVVEPTRANGSRRLYSDADVERLTLLRRATSAGRRIGDVAGLSTSALRELVSDDAESEAGVAIPGGSAAAQHLQVCRKAVRQLDPVGLHQCLANAAVTLSTPVLLEQLIGPLMHDIGVQWREGELRVCHEHMATPQVSGFLHAMVQAAASATSGPIVIVATPAGQHHEVGALMAALTAATEGWAVIYLGADLPAEDIAAAALQRGARAVALSLTFPPDDPALADELRRLSAALPDAVDLLVGGGSVDAYAEVLDQIGISRVNDFSLFRQELERLRGRA
jgi:DNA-binding transcriptional MerR regulator/methanogenic corrinoid protein MtbC1